MNLHSKNNPQISEVLEPAFLGEQVEEFKTKLREENMYLYRKFSLKKTIVQAKNHYPKIWRSE
jgi:hypothetical protein